MMYPHDRNLKGLILSPAFHFSVQRRFSVAQRALARARAAEFRSEEQRLELVELLGLLAEVKVDAAQSIVQLLEGCLYGRAIGYKLDVNELGKLLDRIAQLIVEARSQCWPPQVRVRRAIDHLKNYDSPSDPQMEEYWREASEGAFMAAYACRWAAEEYLVDIPAAARALAELRNLDREGSIANIIRRLEALDQAMGQEEPPTPD